MELITLTMATSIEVSQFQSSGTVYADLLTWFAGMIFGREPSLMMLFTHVFPALTSQYRDP